jgi:ABC-2 type transport system permease protein
MSLRAAVQSELFRATRSGQTLFWAYGLVPAGLLLVGIVSTFQYDTAPAPIRFEVLLRVFGAAGNPFVHLLYAIGAATLFAGEYGWETLRLIVPRNSRANIILAKFGTYALLVFLSLIGSFLAVLLPSAILLLLLGTAEAGLPDLLVPRLLAALFGSLLEAVVIGAAVALIAIVSRSLMASIIVPFLGSLGTTVLIEYLAPPPDTSILLPLPPVAGDAVRYWAEGAADNPAGAQLLLLAFLSLTLWSAALVAASVIAFKEQDLASE